MSDAYTVIASFRFKPGGAEPALEALRELRGPTLEEDGCIAFCPFVDATDPDHLVLIEQWASAAAQEAHFATPHFAKAAPVVEAGLAEPFELAKLRELDED